MNARLLPNAPIARLTSLSLPSSSSPLSLIHCDDALAAGPAADVAVQGQVHGAGAGVPAHLQQRHRVGQEFSDRDVYARAVARGD